MHVVVIGAGITGMFTAYYLLKDGHTVTIIDRDRVAQTSIFNGGLITPSTGVSPPIGLSRILSSMIRPQGPLYISPLEIFRNLTWFRIARRKALTGYEEAILELGRKSLELYRDFFQAESIDADLNQGIIGFYEDVDDAKEAASMTRGQLVDSDEAFRMGFKNVGAGVRFENELSVDPEKLLLQLGGKVSELGAELLLGLKATLVPSKGKIKSVSLSGRHVAGDFYVISAGSWSSEICRPIGYDPQIVPARGLVIIFDAAGERIIDSSAFLEDHGVVISQHNGSRLRVSSFFELVHFKTEFAQSRREWLFGILKRHLVKFDRLRYLNEGVGYRPCTPDQLPVIGMIPNYANAYIASGNCRLGLTMAPATANMIRSMIDGSEPAESWKVFDPSRFGTDTLKPSATLSS